MVLSVVKESVMIEITGRYKGSGHLEKIAMLRNKIQLMEMDIMTEELPRYYGGAEIQRYESMIVELQIELHQKLIKKELPCM